ncbi:sugar-binding transcriptional regulator [Leekyejoonella antrihumi]|nr:sugar-binding domain-containing protein [Leekyejoonella antrihumi]
MPNDVDDVAAQRAMMMTAVRRFYLADESKVKIAADLGVSRFKVARLLEQARATGVVRIEIVGEEGVDPALSEQLRNALGLRNAIVLSPATGRSATELREAIGRLAAQDLARRLTTNDVLGLPWSRTVACMVAALQSLPKIPVVQLSGALNLTGVDSTPVDVVRDATRVSGGAAHLFYAPLVAADTDSASMLRRQPGVAAAFSHVPEVTVAVVGVGQWQPGESTIFDLADADEQCALSAAGAIGEISGGFIDADGAPVTSQLTGRIISINVPQLAAIPEVIGLVTGASRHFVVAAAVRAGLINSLVTDTSLAKALLAAY